MLKNKLQKVFKKLVRYYSLFLKRIWFYQFQKGITQKQSRAIIVEILNSKPNFLAIQNQIINFYLDHNFSFLGCGWTNLNKHKILINSSLNNEYHELNWHTDPKSGYTWDISQKYYNILKTINISPPKDIKFPWELARLQHLPQLAINATISDDPLKLVNECKNVIEDFINNNPIGFGVNWSCTMDIAIRISNILITVDIINVKKFPYVFSDTFMECLSSHVYNTGIFIVNNLEWRGPNPKDKNNHYLADIVGLLFVSLYLQSSEETNKWLAFSIQELIRCVDEQFDDEGVNFESSTSYHLLSTEMVLWATTIAIGMSKKVRKRLHQYSIADWKITPQLKASNNQMWNTDLEELFPTRYLEKVFKMCEYVEKISYQDKIPYIGDNDSGRFFILSKVGEFISTTEAKNKFLHLANYPNSIVNRSSGNDREKLFWDENERSSKHILSIAHALYNKKEFKSDHSNEFHFTTALLNNKFIGIKPKYKGKIGKVYKNSTFDITNLNYSAYLKFDIPSDSISTPNSISWYQNSGNIIVNNDHFHMHIHCPNSFCGHSHFDALSFDLAIKGKPIVQDPGTYLYTSDYLMRNKLRSFNAHLLPSIFNGIGNVTSNQKNVFTFNADFKCAVIQVSSKKVSISLKHESIILLRTFLFKEKSIIVIDRSNYKIDSYNYYPFVSNGYGKLQLKGIS